MADHVPNVQMVPIEMTPELKEKFKTVTNEYIAICKREGLSPLQSYAAIQNVTRALEQYMGIKTFGVIQLGHNETKH